MTIAKAFCVSVLSALVSTFSASGADVVEGRVLLYRADRNRQVGWR